MSKSVSISHTPTVLTVASLDQQPTGLHAIWLRDACICSECRRPTTNERLIDSTRIDLDLTIVAVEQTDDVVFVTTSDRHVARIDLDWLLGHVRSIDFRGRPADGIDLWTSASASDIEALDRSDLDTTGGLGRWLDAVVRRGAAIVRDVSSDEAGLREVAGLVGEIRATNYGVTWAIEADLEPVSAVDSERHLLVHTDLPYRDVAPGVQFILAAVVDVAGGVTTLVDGYAVAERLREADPDAWNLLTTVEFGYPFVRDDVEFTGRAPIIGLHPDGRYHQIRRAPDLVGVPFIADPSVTAELYRAVAAWSALVDDPVNEVRIGLRPGELLAFDNHRLLHGRTAFALGAHGRRSLIGCYLDVEDVRSRRAVVLR